MDAQTKIKIQEAIRENHEWHQTYDDHDGYKGSELEAKNLAALSATEQPEAQISSYIQRYDPFAIPPSDMRMTCDTGGEYVKYSDHISIVATLKRKQERDAEQLTELQSNETFKLLAELAEALDNAFICSSQSTAAWQVQLENAVKYVRRHKL